MSRIFATKDVAPLAGGLAITMVWLCLVVVDQAFLGVDYRFIPHDNDTSWYGMGLLWQTGEPRMINHHPSLTTNAISGLLAWIAGHDLSDASLRTFQVVGMATQGLLVLLSGTWFTCLGNRLRLSVTERGFACFVAFTLPTTLLYTSHWGNYFELAILGLPVGAQLYVAFIENARRDWVVGGLGTGILAANFYPSLAVLGSILAILLLCAVLYPSPQHRVPVRRRPDRFDIIVLVLIAGAACIAAPAASLAILDGRYFGESILLGTAAAVAGCAAYHISSSLDRRIGYFSGGILFGFIPACGILLPGYPIGMITAQSRAASMAETLERLSIGAVDYPWLFAFWVFAAASIVCLAIPNTAAPGRESHRKLLIAALMSSLAIAVAAAGTLEVPTISGLGERLFVAAIPVMVAGWLAILASGPAMLRRIAVAGYVALASWGAVGFYGGYISAVDDLKHEGLALRTAIDDFLERYPSGLVVCARNQYPVRECATGYAYSRYRIDQSTQDLYTRQLFDGRVLWIWTTDGDDVLSGMPSLSERRPLYVIGRPDQRGTLMSYLDALGGKIEDRRVLTVPTTTVTWTDD